MKTKHRGSDRPLVEPPETIVERIRSSALTMGNSFYVNGFQPFQTFQSFKLTSVFEAFQKPALVPPFVPFRAAWR